MNASHPSSSYATCRHIKIRYKYISKYIHIIYTQLYIIITCVLKQYMYHIHSYHIISQNTYKRYVYIYIIHIHIFIKPLHHLISKSSAVLTSLCFARPDIRLSLRTACKVEGWWKIESDEIWMTYCWWTKSCTTKDADYPITYRVWTIPGGAGFLPSTVWMTYPKCCLLIGFPEP